MPGLPVLSPALGFDEAARLVLSYLRDHVPMAFWAVTRVENGRQTYLYLDDDNGYGLPRGGWHDFQDSFCVHMATGAAPAVAPDAQAIDLYAAAGVNDGLDIGAYAGAVVTEPDGSLFGAICGLDPRVRTDDPAFVGVAPLLQLLGQLLTMVLAANRARDDEALAGRTARVDAETDALTCMPNRRAWERWVVQESERFAVYGDPTVVVMLDLDRLKDINDRQGHAAGDDYIRSASQVLLTNVRRRDVVARLGGDEFGVIMAGCTELVAEQRVALLYERLEAAGVAGSMGWAPITVLRGMPAAISDADEAMYAAKRARRVSRAAAALSSAAGTPPPGAQAVLTG